MAIGDESLDKMQSWDELRKELYSSDMPYTIEDNIIQEAVNTMFFSSVFELIFDNPGAYLNSLIKEFEREGYKDVWIDEWETKVVDKNKVLVTAKVCWIE